MERRLAAILCADMVGYSRMMSGDEAGTLAALKSIRHDIIDPAISAHRGRIVKQTGDGILAEFPSAVATVEAAWGSRRKSPAGTVPLLPDRLCSSVSASISAISLSKKMTFSATA